MDLQVLAGRSHLGFERSLLISRVSCLPDTIHYKVLVRGGGVVPYRSCPTNTQDLISACVTSLMSLEQKDFQSSPAAMLVFGQLL